MVWPVAATTGVDAAPADVVPGAPQRRQAAVTALLAIGLFAVALVARLLGISRTYELFLDEVTYAALTQSVSEGRGVLLHGELFFLHPPGWFVSTGLAFRGQLADERLDQVAMALRPVNAVLGSITVALTVLVLRRLTDRKAIPLLIGVALALDPFLVKFDSRFLLESQAMVLTTGAVLVLARAPRSSQGARRQGIAAGVLMAGAILTKEPYALITALPVAVMALVGAPPGRRVLVPAMVTTVAVYATYLGSLAARDELSLWWTAKTSGFSRLIGVSQETGFNAPGSPSLASRITELVEQFAGTYLLLAAGGVTLGVLVVRGWASARYWSRSTVLLGVRAAEPARVVAVAWAASSYTYVAYAVLLGTLEEQAFYMVVAPTALCLCVIATTRTSASRTSGPNPARAFAVLLTAMVVANGLSWVVLHQRTDDGYAQLRDFLDDEVPDGSRISVTEETAQFTLPDYDVGNWTSLAELRENQVQYVLVAEALVQRGYGSARPGFLADVERIGDPVFEREVPTLGRLVLLDVQGATR
ncbi:ArnT family glycosyltransferase [Modestobacter versicolor]|uniref:ArnT family glycosyltransferase n=1 Tax=Modestobacter versicolor TaxID=429133 RepID=UPI0034E033BB